MKKVSVIVPVYNGERYLDTCVSSILAQTESDLELILVDDGSADSSGAICDRWAEKDARVRVIHQQNQGVSAARNAGLDAAKGEYIGFVDADDRIAPETYETALRNARDHDIVMWDAVTLWGDGRTEPDTIPLLEQTCTIARQDWYPALLGQMAGSAWRCLYKAELLSGIRFPVGIKLSEDRMFNLQAMGCANSVCYLKTPLYYRLMHAESAVHRYHADHFETGKAAYAAILEILQQFWGGETEYIRIYDRQLIGSAQGAIHNYFYKTSPLTLKQKWEKVRQLTADPMLQQALSRAGTLDARGRLMKAGMTSALCVLAWLANKKHGR